MQPRSLAIFDFDGTVADSAQWLFDVFNDVARAHGFREVTADEREFLRSRSSRELLAYLHVPRWKLPAIARTMRKFAARDLERIRPFPWVPELFQALTTRGTAIAIVSSNSEANIRHVLGADAVSCVTCILGGASLFGKAAKLRSVMRRSSVSPERAAFIGDEVRDIDAAHAAGITSLAVTWGYAATAALEAARPTRLVRQPGELLDLFGT